MPILRADEVVAMTGVSFPTLDRLERQGQFPRRVALSSRLAGWREAEVRDWVTARVERRKDSVERRKDSETDEGPQAA